MKNLAMILALALALNAAPLLAQDTTTAEPAPPVIDEGISPPPVGDDAGNVVGDPQPSDEGAQPEDEPLPL